jgi:hypothetical protein
MPRSLRIGSARSNSDRAAARPACCWSSVAEAKILLDAHQMGWCWSIGGCPTAMARSSPILRRCSWLCSAPEPRKSGTIFADSGNGLPRAYEYEVRGQLTFANPPRPQPRPAPWPSAALRKALAVG